MSKLVLTRQDKNLKIEKPNNVKVFGSITLHLNHATISNITFKLYYTRNSRKKERISQLLFSKGSYAMLYFPENNSTMIHIYIAEYAKMKQTPQNMSQFNATRDHFRLFCFTFV